MTEPKDFPWTRIEVGYTLLGKPKNITEAYRQEILATSKSLRELLSDRFSPMRRLFWLTGHTTRIDEPLTGHYWVAQVLTDELNRALQNTPKRFDLKEDKLVVKLPYGHVAKDDEPKPHGTRCKLIGDRWFNYRSYRLDEKVLQIPISAQGMLFATLVWPCESAECDADALVDSIE